ncbi:MAG: DUF397 domain-containing protein [Actinophytocola sp.]|uniref:DUF397 domain-containing protein n=1 Tax=Actinophytocola sp. TaxID=1872138 RepID=UPI003C77FD27
MKEPVRWRRSSRSGQESNCVELANNLGAVRDSKNPTGPELRAQWSGLVAAVKAGNLTR